MVIRQFTNAARLCVCVLGGGGGGGDLYSRFRLGNTFVFIEPVCASAIYVSFQV